MLNFADMLILMLGTCEVQLLKGVFMMMMMMMMMTVVISVQRK